MFLSCFHQNCKELDLLICKCQIPSVHMCKSHLSVHNQTNPLSNHNCSRDDSIHNKSTNDEFTQALKDSLNSYENLKLSFISTLNNLNLKASEFISKLDDIIINLNKQIYNSIINSKIYYQEDQKDYTKNYPSTQASTKEILNIDQKCWDFLEVPEFAEKFNSIFESSIKNVYLKFKTIFMDESKNNLYYFENDTIKLKIFNIDEVSVSSRIAHLEYEQNNLGGMCLVNENTLFFYEDCEGKNPASYLVNLTNFGATKIRGEIKNSYASCTLYKRKVYIFGGYYKSALQKSQYLDLDELKYYELSNLPSKQYSTSVLNIDQNFIISGNSYFLCVYNIPQDIYKVQLTSESFGKYHLIMNIGRNIYAVLKNYIYLFEYCDEKLEKIKYVKIQDTGFSYVTGKPVMRGNFGYFNDYSGDIYRVDLKNFNINRIFRVVKKDD